MYILDLPKLTDIPKISLNGLGTIIVVELKFM